MPSPLYPPTIVLAVATTGLPRKGFTPRIVEVAAVLVTPQGDVGSWEKGGAWASLVKREKAELLGSQPLEAFKFHGIPSKLSLVAPSEVDAAKALGLWIANLAKRCNGPAGPLSSWYAYNRRFVEARIAGSPFEAALERAGLTAGRCLMAEAAEKCGGTGKGSRSMDKAFAALGLEGWHDAPVAHGGPGSALPQAVRAARIAVALRARPAKAPAGAFVAGREADRLDNVFGPDPWGDD